MKEYLFEVKERIVVYAESQEEAERLLIEDDPHDCVTVETDVNLLGVINHGGES